MVLRGRGHMRRRDLLAGLLATTTASALWAAEPDKVYRLAAVSRTMDNFSRGDTPWGTLFDGLRKLGYIEGKNLVLDLYATEGRTERFPEVARNLVRLKPDVIALALAHQL